MSRLIPKLVLFEPQLKEDPNSTTATRNPLKKTKLPTTETSRKRRERKRNPLLHHPHLESIPFVLLYYDHNQSMHNHSCLVFYLLTLFISRDSSSWVGIVVLRGGVANRSDESSFLPLGLVASRLPFPYQPSSHLSFPGVMKFFPCAGPWKFDWSPCPSPKVIAFSNCWASTF